MDEEQLNAIRERSTWTWHTRTSGTDSSQAFADRLALLAEVDRLRAERYDEATLFKVYRALGRADITDQQATDAVSQMQNAGILFRERATDG